MTAKDKEQVDSIYKAVLAHPTFLELLDAPGKSEESIFWKENYAVDEWAWVSKMYQKVFDTDLTAATSEDILAATGNYLKVRGKFLRLIISDAQKEFDELSQSGFGADGGEQDVTKDFNEVRGLYQENKFVKEMQQNVADLEKRIGALESKIK